MIKNPSQLSGLRSPLEILHLPAASRQPSPPDIGTKKPRKGRGFRSLSVSSTVQPFKGSTILRIELFHQ